MKKIENLVKDIQKTIEGKGGWQASISESFGMSLAYIADTRFSQPQKTKRLSISFVCWNTMSKKVVVQDQQT
jgi:hypothetical protein